MTGCEGRCAVLARAVDEPLAGTAPQAARWVALEHRGAWPRDIASHPDPSISGFAARASAAGWRPLLIRRPGRRGPDGPTRVFLADTVPGAARTTVLTITGPHDLTSVPLPRADTPIPGEPVRDPLLLVCTHGRRDRCCAVDGRALAVAVTTVGEPNVWECSHLGGHRFAPTALVLPTGYLYGRLDAATAISARKAAALGEMEAGLSRGRSTWSAAGQVAELAVRDATGLRDADALTLDPLARPGTVVVSGPAGRRWAVEVAERPGVGHRPASCGVAALPYVALHATAVLPLP
ncbi:sucrase ferredoxin [Pseudonocardia abyssalis]|uniref:Sucrase ferredoxin n=1 Tax=Pseudonocardia abyssalis TaxID=2792008 RepID=A0ABS6V1X8_9PSEU|nr:sucrase ferredoxin [Pseudonocardia abyssalis]MBW0118465.1 sucrase ferredoxin [Pseudonocardia abyssalis]MBW0138518.1 sucrase ferredoxin [Pseudonocardia abyssalis]